MAQRPVLTVFVLLPLAALGAWLSPRLQAADAETASIESSPCFRWGAVECCYTDEDVP